MIAAILYFIGSLCLAAAALALLGLYVGVIGGRTWNVPEEPDQELETNG